MTPSRIMRTLIAALGAGFGFLAQSPESRAGAWLMDDGKGQVVITGTPSGAVTAFDGDRDLQPTPHYSKFELTALVEYGVTDWFTAIVAPQLQHIGIAAPTDASRSGLGYGEFGGRFRLMKGDDWILSAQTTLRVAGTSDSLNPAAIGYTDNEIDARLLFGKSFSIGAWPAFIDLQAAQRWRTGAPPDEFRGDITFGIRPDPKWLVLAQTFSVVSQGSGSALFPSYDYHKLQMSVVHELSKDLALQAGAFTTFSGRNALQENGVVTGLWYKF